MSATTNPFDTESRNWRGRLAASVDLMRALSRSSDPQEMYTLFSRRMDELFPVTRRLSLSRRGLRAPEYRVTRCSLWKDAANPWTEPERLPVHRGGVLADLLYADEPRLLTNHDVSPDDPAVAYLAGQRSVLAIPHFEQGVALNALILAPREEPDAFPRDRIPDLVMLSNLFGRATPTLVLSQAVKGAFDAADFEMKAVADIQRALLPDSVPQVPGLDIAVDYRAAARAGGDYYDFFPLPGGRFGVLVADASGHGAPAAVLMAMTHSIAHTLHESDRACPRALLTQLNAHLARRYTRPTGSFVTAFAAVFDPANRTLTYASAGHSPPLVARADGTRSALNRAQAPLGIKPTETYPEQTTAFHPGDRVVVVTDGILEAANEAGDMFGTAGVGAALRPVCDAAADDLASVLGAWAVYTAGVPTADDRTVVVVRGTGGEP